MATTDGFSLKLTVTDHSPEALRQLESALVAGLTECGLQAERTAKQRCPVGKSKRGYIGGTLRNSITFALDGEKPVRSTFDVTEGHKGVKGEYRGEAPKEKGSDRALYVGTNVYYAPYVELGTKRYPTARPFIRPALSENGAKFLEIIKKHIRDTTASVYVSGDGT